MSDIHIKEMRSFSVVKSNTLIQNSRYSLSVIEQRIVLFLISKIKPTDSFLKPYSFSINEFCEVCGLNKGGYHYAHIKDAIKTLADKSIWVILEDGKQTLARWIERPILDAENGVIDIKLDELMKPFLLELKEKFTMYDLFHILGMKSQYSIRLYELLKSYEYKRSQSFAIDELQRLLDAEVYAARFPDFRRRVLEKAVSEINALSDIDIEYAITTKGRKVTHVTFKITTKDLDERIVSWYKIKRLLDGSENPDQIEHNQGDLSKPMSTG